MSGRQPRTLSAERTSSLSLRRWTVLCALAEALGMTAGAAAAKLSQRIVGDHPSGVEGVAALSVIVAGGLVEGIALGGLQAAGLRRMLPGLDRRRWIIVTTAVAGLGWAAASAPAALSSDSDGRSPPVLLILGGAAALGLAMGAVLGTAQAAVLRRQVRHPWRWVGANAAGWTPAMIVIFAGATTPGRDSAVASVVALGTFTGLAAGAVLGVVTGWFLPTLDGAQLHDQIVLYLLRSRVHGAVDGMLLALRVRGRMTGRRYELPVQYAQDECGLVVVPGRPATKTWWRNLLDPAPVEVLLKGQWRDGHGALLRPGDPTYAAACAAYCRRWPRVRLPEHAPVVRIRLDPPLQP